jgi:cobalt-zinc-cadmium efflux system protein
MSEGTDGHSHSHGHSHGHSHAHSHGTQALSGAALDERRILYAVMLTGGFMVIEVIGAIWSDSLALLADAGHMATDTAALSLAWLAFRIARMPSDGRRSFGYHRMQVLAAFVNALALIGICGWILFKAFWRLFDPPVVIAELMAVIAFTGLLVNIAAFALLSGRGQGNINVRGATLHILSDLLGSIAALAAAAVIIWTGWMAIDPLLSIGVVILILNGALKLVKQTGHILLEGSPDGVDPDRIAKAVRDAVPAVEDVHHVHAWSLTPDRPLVSMHARIKPEAEYDQTLKGIHDALVKQFDIGHATIQIERAECTEPTGAVTSLRPSRR